ncbi:hypothetical protein DL768_009991 [Monosporascus sp. mg162]|nr:hypothetical protein DL768_009991 [Monosporascus sp. mg162]
MSYHADTRTDLPASGDTGYPDIDDGQVICDAPNPGQIQPPSQSQTDWQDPLATTTSNPGAAGPFCHDQQPHFPVAQDENLGNSLDSNMDPDQLDFNLVPSLDSNMDLGQLDFNHVPSLDTNMDLGQLDFNHVPSLSMSLDVDVDTRGTFFDNHTSFVEIQNEDFTTVPVATDTVLDWTIVPQESLPSVSPIPLISNPLGSLSPMIGLPTTASDLSQAITQYGPESAAAVSDLPNFLQPPLELPAATLDLPEIAAGRDKPGSSLQLPRPHDDVLTQTQTHADPRRRFPSILPKIPSTAQSSSHVGMALTTLQSSADTTQIPSVSTALRTSRDQIKYPTATNPTYEEGQKVKQGLSQMPGPTSQAVTHRQAIAKLAGLSELDADYLLAELSSYHFRRVAAQLAKVRRGQSSLEETGKLASELVILILTSKVYCAYHLQALRHEDRVRFHYLRIGKKRTPLSIGSALASLSCANVDLMEETRVTKAGRAETGGGETDEEETDGEETDEEETDEEETDEGDTNEDIFHEDCLDEENVGEEQAMANFHDLLFRFDFVCAPHSVDKLELADVRLADQTPEQREALAKRMDRAGRASGIHFNWGGKLGPNPATRDAHRLVYLVGAQDKYDDETQRNLVEAIFEAYHCGAQDVAEHDVLREAMRRAGVDAADVEEWLQSNETADVIDREADKSKGTVAGSGVPTLVIQGRHRPEGIPDPADLMEIFIQVKEIQS